MTQETRRESRSEWIGRFAGQLDKLYESIGRPELDILASIADEEGSVPLAPRTVEEKLRGESAPSWEFVATFVGVCEKYATEGGLSLPRQQFSLKAWRDQFQDMLQGLSAERSVPDGGPREPDPSRRLSTLPPSPPGFGGRTNELAELGALIADRDSHPWLIVIQGEPGMGKTALATVWAHQTAPLFPDGQHFLPGTAAKPAEEAADDRLGQLLLDVGILTEDVPESTGARLELLRTRMERQRLLIVLDDADEDTIRALQPLGEESRSLLVVTTRTDLSGAQWPGESAVLRLGPLGPREAWALLTAQVPPGRLDADASALRGAPPEVAGNPLMLRLLAGLLDSDHRTGLEELLDTFYRRGGQGLSEVLRRIYDRIGEPAALVLRRLSLVDEYEEIPRRLVVFLAGDVPPDTLSAALDELTSAGLVMTSPDGEVVRLTHAAVRRFAHERVTEQDSPEERIAVRDRARRFFLLSRGYRPQPERSIARDAYTLNDQLSYSHYAAAIAEFIRHRQTEPPLTIGLKAPWGAGKTSLMRMIQNILDPRDRAREEPCRIRLSQGAGRGRVTNREILAEARAVTADEPAPLSAGPDRDGHWRPTVWFNPWMYQNGEQIWAGLAHEIITQVTERLPVADRERFWLRLNLARVDRSVIRRRWYRLLAERLLPFLVFWLLAAVVAVAVLVFGELAGPAKAVFRQVSAGVFGGGTLGLLGWAAWRGMSFLGSTATGPLSNLVNRSDVLGGGQRLLGAELKQGFDQLVPDPGYAGRLGFLHLVQTDMKRVLDLIASRDRPLVVFVDDLDRCSPSAVTQVIEAINLFLAGEFPHCVFVLGMEPGTVAAHVEVAYQDLVKAQRDGRLAGDWSTLGWRFLEKIVQLPLSIPPPRGEDELAGYLRSLVTAGVPSSTRIPDTAAAPTSAEGRDGERRGGEREAPASGSATPTTPGGRARQGVLAVPDLELTRPDPSEVDAIEESLRARRPTPDTLRAMALEAQFEVLGLPEPLHPAGLAAADRVLSDLYSDVDAHAVLEDLLPVLSSRNPREIKRFVNLFRFYSFIAERQRLLGAPMPAQRQIAKLAAFAIRWPHVISMLGASDTDRVLGSLEQAARHSDPDRWTTELRSRFPVFAAASDGGSAPGWGDDLRAFLSEDVEIAAVASRFV